MEIRRDAYLNELIIRMHNRMIKVITGIRRCGESYLMNSLFYRYLTESVTDDSHIENQYSSLFGKIKHSIFHF